MLLLYNGLERQEPTPLTHAPLSLSACGNTYRHVSRAGSGGSDGGCPSPHVASRIPLVIILPSQQAGGIQDKKTTIGEVTWKPHNGSSPPMPPRKALSNPEATTGNADSK